jgi:hypothetical protein
MARFKRSFPLAARETCVCGQLIAGEARKERARRNEEPIAMANILVNIEKGIEVGASDVLQWLGKAHTALQAAPAVVAALATLISAVDKPLLDLSGVVANPLNIALDFQTASDLKAVWPDVKTFLGTLGVKF